ncbi:hypothetical protein GA0070618_6321 [Micromonospora echinospora]|uniref:Transposase n=1 Tax=Micromonospora echinospora TaxID=1877 RepID=A0A1C5A4Z7_MICEC|nr:hypothetical protein GA0070618_6321 [Micromonospora echinospora]
MYSSQPAGARKRNPVTSETGARKVRRARPRCSTVCPGRTGSTESGQVIGTEHAFRPTTSTVHPESGSRTVEIGTADGANRTIDARTMLAAVRKEMWRMEVENEILRRAAAHFARENVFP